MKGRRPILVLVALGLCLYLPFLGSSGLWDPWETHYAEVAREMVVGDHWLEPTWEWSPGQSTERKFFFSKPPLSMWLMAGVLLGVPGLEAQDQPLPESLGWWLRLPFVLCAILGVLAVYWLAATFFGRKVGLLAGVILATCPQYFFIARQAMTDMPFLALVTTGLAALVIGGLDDNPPRTRLLYLGYACLGLSVLSKGLTGPLLPGLIFLVYFLTTWDWIRLGRMRVLSGGLLSVLIAAPWMVYLSLVSLLQNLVDDEGKTFAERFFLHDHLLRLGSGVHGDRGNFSYFIEQLGLGTHPWFPAMLLGGWRVAVGLNPRSLDRGQRAEWLLMIWALVGFGLYSFSMTKFHHYALPIVPALAILAALWLIRLAEGREHLGLALGLLFLTGLCLISRDIALMPKALVDLFVYKYDREFPKEEAFASQIGFAIIFGLMCVGLIVVYLWRRERLPVWLTRLLPAGALLGAILGGWVFFPQMGPHWSQKHLFDTYYGLQSQAEPIGAYMMNWRGETFYSRNQISQIKNDVSLQKWLVENAGRRVFVVTEVKRLSRIRDQLGPEKAKNLRILDRSNHKFYLISIELPENPNPSPASPIKDKDEVETEDPH